jgi:hypothetical protein
VKKDMNRKIKNNDEGVSTVIGSILMIGIVSSMMMTQMLITNSVNNANIEANKAVVRMLTRFSESLDNVQFGNGKDSLPVTTVKTNNESLCDPDIDPFIAKNKPPMLLSLSVFDKETEVELQPTLNIHVIDFEQDPLTAKFYYKETTGASIDCWTFDREIIIPPPVTEVSWQFTAAANPGTVYHWMVDVSDGEYNTVGIYSFVTESIPAP